MNATWNSSCCADLIATQRGSAQGVVETQRGLAVNAPLKPALVDARQQLLERAHVHVPLELVAGEPHAEAVDLVLRGILVDLLLAVVLQCALERQRLDASEARGVEALDVRLERPEERVVDEQVLFLLLVQRLRILLLRTPPPPSSSSSSPSSPSPARGASPPPRARTWTGRRPRACALARAGRPPRGSTGSRVGGVPPWNEWW